MIQARPGENKIIHVSEFGLWFFSSQSHRRRCLSSRSRGIPTQAVRSGFPQVRAKGSRVEFRIDGVDLESGGVDVKVDDALDLVLVAADSGRVPSPGDLVAVVEEALGGHDGQGGSREL